MKRILLTLLTMSALMGAAAQTTKCGIDTRALVAEELTSGATQIRFLAKLAPGFNPSALEKEGITVGARAGNIVTLTVPVEKLHLLDNNKQILQYSISHRIAAPLCNNNRIDTRTDSVQNGWGILGDTTYTGRGVYIGITDWGFDYTHPNYNSAGLTNLRVVKAWDHFRLEGPAPQGFNYGTEITGTTDLHRYQCDTINFYGRHTHGTHVAGICAGRGKQGNQVGQAPDANLLFCTFGLSEAEWMDGVAWMRQVAQDSARRLVVNSSWGMYSFSTLDGTSLLSQAINNWSDEGTVFCTSAGNNGTQPYSAFHVSRTFRNDTIDTLRTVARRASEIYVITEVGQSLILWGTEGHDFSAGVRLQQGENIWQSPMLTTASDTIIYDTIHCNGTDVAYRALIEHANPFDNRPHMQIDVAKSNLELQLFITATEGTVHAWNLATLANRAGNQGCGFTSRNREGFTDGDILYGIGEPACAAQNISVAAHTSDKRNSDTTGFITGNIASFSSSGPLIDGTLKPEISAPGVAVVSSINFFTDQHYDGVMSWTLGINRYIWDKMDGTSMSCPAVTGVVALMLEANPALTVSQIREIIRTTARNDDKTGPLVETNTHDLRWGWGKIDALAAVNEAVSRIGINQAETLGRKLTLYPNPACNSVVVKTGCGEREQMSVYTIDGRQVLQTPVCMEAVLDISRWERGVYIVRIGSRTGKLIVK